MNIRIPSGAVLLISGFTSMIVFAAQPLLLIRIGQTIILLLLAIISGRKIRPVLSVATLSAVVIINLLFPSGKVLATVVGQKITQGALELGLLKGFLLIGLINLSRITVTDSVRLPGTFGWLLFRMFSYFEYLRESWKEQRGPIFGRLDALLLEAKTLSIREGDRQARTGREGNVKKLILAGIVLLLCWGPFLGKAAIAAHMPGRIP